jgi:nucleotide-binding universal stress UspA family protein
MRGMFRSLLCAIDLGETSGDVIARAALLPLATAARLTLLHVVPDSFAPAARRRAVGDARKLLAGVAADLEKRVPRGVKVKQKIRVGDAAAEIIKQGPLVHAELIVMTRGQRRALRELFLGSTAERVLRGARLPILVVRGGAHGRGYQRPLLALDTDQAAARVVALALQALPKPRPHVEIVHADDAQSHRLVYPSVAAAASPSGERPDQVIDQLVRLMAKAAHGDEISVGAHVVRGAPRAVIVQKAAEMRADLVAMGTQGRAGVARALLGTVAGDVLRTVGCDVLVVPPGRRG